MTRGTWTSGGRTILIVDMPTGHLMNSIRYVARNIHKDGASMPAWQRRQSAMKIMELAEVAQRRGLLPDPIHLENLLASAPSWPTRKDDDTSMAVVLPAGVPMAIPPPLPVASFMDSPPEPVVPRMSYHIDVVVHVEELNMDLLLENQPCCDNRVLTFDDL